MSDMQIHFEEFLYIPALTHSAVLIAWGGFFFEVKENHGRKEYELLDVDKVTSKVPKLKGVKELIGQNSRPYGEQARIEYQAAGGAAEEIGIAGANSVVIQDLQPDTVYTYRVFVTEDGKEREWAAGQRLDWVIKDGKGTLAPGGTYKNIFRTFPEPGTATPPFSFLVIGDFGRGIRKAETEGHERCQLRVAEAMAAAAADNNVRFVLTTGDNVYAKNIFGSSSGDEDDDWYSTYFQPYRYILNRLPVFPAVGNHDDQDNEKSIDRQQVYDNLYLSTQFNQLRDKQDCSMALGLFYRFEFGKDVEFICLDTSKGKSQNPQFELPENADFIKRCLARKAPQWRIVFSHHPAYSAGPRHFSEKDLQQLIKGQPDVRVCFSGHEHNFQYARDGNQHHILTGGGGKYRIEEPNPQKLTVDQYFWGGNNEGHFLFVTIRDKQMEVCPYGYLEAFKLRQIALNPAHDGPFSIEA